MVEYKIEHVDNVFYALSNHTRRQLLECMAKNHTYHITQLAKPFSMSLNAISKHIKVLEKANLIKRRVKGRIHYISLNHQPLYDVTEVINYLKHHWETRLDSLEEYLTKQGD